MGDLAIEVRGLSKQYRLGADNSRYGYGRLTESLSAAMRAPFKKLRGVKEESSPDDDLLWALKDVSFDVEHGEAVGIIGRNGAGKTTLLKVLSRITEPTEGYARIVGSVGALLEVGTGFHPELTGRENIFLSGAILGMGRAEIQRKLDDIIAFAEVERFTDTPVKRFSTGMYLRLAFSVAAHLQPQILIVDEVLAVGDVAFQRKCLGKMGDVAKEGRTVLFVSHNMGAVSRLCRRGLWLDRGQVVASGPMEDIVPEYLLSSASGNAEYVAENMRKAPGNDVIRLRSVRVKNQEGQLSPSVDPRHPVYVEIEHVVFKSTRSLRTVFRLLASDGTVVFTSSDTDNDTDKEMWREPGVYVSTCEIPGRLLRSGQYSITVGSDVPMVQTNFHTDVVVTFSAEDVVEEHIDRRLGIITPNLPWQVERVAEDASEVAGAS